MAAKESNKGVAFFISLALLLLLSIGAATFYIIAYNYANISEGLSRGLRAITLAESGINYAYWKIRIGEDDNNNPLTFPTTLTPPISIPTGWTIQVDITEDAVTGRKTIRSTVNYPKASVI